MELLWGAVVFNYSLDYDWLTLAFIIIYTKARAQLIQTFKHKTEEYSTLQCTVKFLFIRLFTCFDEFKELKKLANFLSDKELN